MKMLKHLDQIAPRPTSHGIGLKRVLLSGDETEATVCVDRRALLCRGGIFCRWSVVGVITCSRSRMSRC